MCCTGNAITAGSFDQRKMESRHDILVYASEAFKEGIEVSDRIARYPNLKAHLARMRARDGYKRAEAKGGPVALGDLFRSIAANATR